VLFVGDDWAVAHHDVELMDATGQRLAKARLPEGVAGMARLHAMIGEQLGEDTEAEVLVGIETDRGPWVLALIAAGYTVYGINPLQVPATGNGAACRARKATPLTRTPWLTWCAPIPTSCARWPPTAPRPRQSRW
jgi:hypothetical protein